jgi:hypothetical protein
MCSAPAERDVPSGVMYASQVMCASRVESGTHLITAAAGRIITFDACGKIITCADDANITFLITRKSKGFRGYFYFSK